jgi:lysophospholipid acyltransferase (LPLAT)-like uncharacterized protein
MSETTRAIPPEETAPGMMEELGPEEADPEARPPHKHARRPWKRFRRRVGYVVVGWCGPTALARLASTWKVQLIGEEHVERARAQYGGHMMALWHGRMIVGLPHHAHRHWSVLVSQSGDGDISQRLLRGFGYSVIRGSSSSGGSRALREMLTVLRRGEVLIITPDGPRGPRHSVNPGLAWMARATGYPVVPLGFGVDRAWRMRSWDRFTIPKPGARITMVYGEPVHVPREASDADLARTTEELQKRLLEVERRGFEALGLPVDW